MENEKREFCQHLKIYGEGWLPQAACLIYFAQSGELRAIMMRNGISERRADCPLKDARLNGRCEFIKSKDDEQSSQKP